MYPIDQPYTLNALDETKPLDSEDAALLAAVDRQTRTLLKEVFLLEHEPDGAHKPVDKVAADAIGTTQIANESITNEKIVDETINGATKLAPNSVTGDRLAPDAVGEAAMGNGSVGTGTLKDLAVTTPKLDNNAVTDAKLRSSATSGERAVTSAHIRNDAVQSDHIADQAVTPAKLGGIGNGQIVVGTGSGPQALPVGGQLAMTVVGGVAQFSLQSEADVAGLVMIESTAGGAAAAGTWNARPSLTRLRGEDVVEIVSGNRIRFLVPGTFLVEAQAVAYSVDAHQLRLRDITAAETVAEGLVLFAPFGTQSASFVQVLLTVNEANQNNVYEFQHFTETASSVGLGRTLAGLNLKTLTCRAVRIN